MELWSEDHLVVKGGWHGYHFLNIGETMNQDRYIQTLEEHMLTIFKVQGCEVLMQDGISFHVARHPE